MVFLGITVLQQENGAHVFADFFPKAPKLQDVQTFPSECVTQLEEHPFFVRLTCHQTSWLLMQSVLSGTCASDLSEGLSPSVADQRCLQDW